MRRWISLILLATLVLSGLPDFTFLCRAGSDPDRDRHTRGANCLAGGHCVAPGELTWDHALCRRSRESTRDGLG